MLGIDKCKRPIFLKRYHDELIAAKESQESSEDLLNSYENLSENSKELYRLPINLAILSWIWSKDKIRAKSINSSASLYGAIIEILNEKLLSRLHDSPYVAKKSNKQIKVSIKYFEKQLCIEALAALKNDRMYIDDNDVKRLMDACKDIQLPFDELAGSFLLTKLDHSNNLEESLEVGHKAFLDYFSAMRIMSLLISCSNNINTIFDAKCLIGY